jgi:toluene monooxygenase system ferredoxin subunit
MMRLRARDAAGRVAMAQRFDPRGGQCGMWKKVCQVADVPQNGMKEFAVDGAAKVLIVHTGSEFVAVQAMCPHEAVPLEQGIHDGAVLTCLEHLWQFDLKTGAPLGDAETGLSGYRLKEEDGALHVWIEAGERR